MQTITNDSDTRLLSSLFFYFPPVNRGPRSWFGIVGARSAYFVYWRGERTRRVTTAFQRDAGRNNIARSDDAPLLIAGNPAVVVLRLGITRAQSYYWVLISESVNSFFLSFFCVYVHQWQRDSSRRSRSNRMYFIITRKFNISLLRLKDTCALPGLRESFSLSTFPLTCVYTSCSSYVFLYINYRTKCIVL